MLGRDLSAKFAEMYRVSQDDFNIVFVNDFLIKFGNAI